MSLAGLGVLRVYVGATVSSRQKSSMHVTSLTAALGCSNDGSALLCGATDRCVDLRGAASPLIADGPLTFDTTTVKILSTAGRIAISGNSSRVFVVSGSASLELENLDLTEGYHPTVTPLTPLRVQKPLPCVGC